MPKQNADFMPHINGLRALAIALVVLYHLNAEWCPCGYFGVDVFLLISGYFLFSKELQPQRVENMHYGQYLLRKAWRLGPPTLTVGIVVAVIGAFVLLQDLYWMALQTLTYCCVAGSNEYVAHSGNYFSPNTQSNPLMHLWYIGLILQTYILLPAAAIAMRKLSPTARGCIWWLLGGVSFAAYHFLQYGEAWESAVVTVKQGREWFSPYYSIVTRLWEPMLAMLVLMLPVIPATRTLLRSVAAVAGLGLVIGSCYAFETGSASVFCAVLGGILLLQYGASGIVGKLLALRPVQWLGTVSFSLYLVHWPIFAMWRYIMFEEVSPAQLAIAAAVSLLLAWALWRWVETRCGSWQKSLSSRAMAWLSAAVPACVITITSLFTWNLPLANLLPNRPSEVQRSFELPILTGYATEEHLLGFPREVFNSTPILLGNDTTAPISFLLIGDSHSWHLQHGMDKLLCEQGGRRGLYLNNSCVPAWDTFILLSAGDSKWDRARGERMLEWIINSKDINCVVLSVYWNLRFRDKNIRDWNLRAIPREQARAHQENGLRETCRRLKAAGKRVIVVKDTPFFPRSENHVDRFVRRSLIGIPYELPTQTPEQMAQRTAEEAAFFRSLTEQNLAEVIDASPSLQENGLYPIRLSDGSFLYRDTNHLASRGSILVSDFILRYMQSTPAQQD